MTTYNDYNDGNWHGWNGGDCPVHPKSVVEMVYSSPQSTSGFFNCEGPASYRVWENDRNHRPIAFRVVKPYVEPPKPREVWINEYPGGSMAVHMDAETAERRRTDAGKTTRWIEVLE